MSHHRRFGPLVHALIQAAALPPSAVAIAPALAACATVLTACADENDPMTHVKRLDDAVKRTGAVERLIQMYNDKMTLDQQKRDGENVKPLLDKIVQPLSDLATKGDLDQKTQGHLLAMLADTHDKRAIPALVKALDGYAPDDKRPEEFDANMNDVVRCLGEMRATEASDALLKLFQHIHASWPKAGEANHRFYETIQDAMMQILDKKWEDPLIKMLDAPIKTLNQKELRAITDQVYWQTVSALLLGELRSVKAVPALLKVVISPFKANIGSTAMAALIKIGKPSVDAAVKLLSGQDAELQKYAEEEFLRAAQDKGEKVDDKKKKDAQKAYLDNSVFIVANIGNAAGTPPMLAAIDKGDDTTDAIVASKLFMMPADPKINDAFKKVWDEVKLGAPLPGSDLTAKEALTDAASGFLDQGLAQYIGEQTDSKLKGEASDIAPVQEQALMLLLKVGGPKQMDLLDKLAGHDTGEEQGADKDKKDKKGAGKNTFAKQYSKELKIAKAMVKDCGEKADCYLKKLSSAEAQKDSGFMGIKAAYMAAIYGGDAVRAKLVDMRASSGILTNAAVIFTVESMIDRLAPKGDKAAADKLQKVVDRAVAAKDTTGITNLKTVINRLRARAV